MTEEDWAAALRHAVGAAPGGRLGARLTARLAALPQSHHHRYPIYEQVMRGGRQLACCCC